MPDGLIQLLTWGLGSAAIASLAYIIYIVWSARRHG